MAIVSTKVSQMKDNSVKKERKEEKIFDLLKKKIIQTQLNICIYFSPFYSLMCNWLNLSCFHLPCCVNPEVIALDRAAVNHIYDLFPALSWPPPVSEPLSVHSLVSNIAH